MKSNKIAISILIFVTLSFCQNISIDVKNIVKDFILKQRLNSTNSFRSALIYEDNSVKNLAIASLEDPIFSDSGYDLADQNKKWRNGNYEEYAINYENQINIISKKFEKKHNNLQIKYDSLSKEYRILPIIPPGSAIRLSNQKLLIVADSIFEAVLPSLKKHCEYDVYSTMLKDDVLYNMIVRYRRIFKSGIIRNNASSVNVQIDSAGNLVEIFIKWPKLTKLASSIDTFSSIKLSDDVVGIVIAQIENSTTEPDIISRKLTKAEITGISFGWFPSDINAHEFLTPCYSFSTNFYYNDGFQTGQTIDIPVLKKYYSEK